MEDKLCVSHVCQPITFGNSTYKEGWVYVVIDGSPDGGGELYGVFYDHESAMEMASKDVWAYISHQEIK